MLCAGQAVEAAPPAQPVQQTQPVQQGQPVQQTQPAQQAPPGQQAPPVQSAHSAPTAQAGNSPDSAGSAGPQSRVSVLSGVQVIQILDETVDWYRTLGIQQQNASQPSDLLIVFANRQIADKVVGLAFEIARANAELLSSEATAAQSAADASSPQALDQQQAQLAAQRQALQQEMSIGRGSSAKAKQDMASKLPELQGELAMVDARKNLLDTMKEFVSERDPKGAGANALKQQIDAIAASIPTSTALAAPGASATPGSASTGASPTATGAGKAGPSRYGIWELATNVLQLRNKISTIDVIDRRTADLARTFEQISAPPLKQLQALSARSDALAKQADSADSAALKSLRGEFDTLAWLFKQTSAILIPLTKEQVLLQQYRHNLANWQEATQRQYHEALQALGIRLCFLIGILVAVFVLAEVWKRAVFRYAHETRRRYQLLLIRKIVLWALVVAIVGLSFITEISALATFAGLLTAGVAVAMQSVLVSVVGYFFLIGKYGIR
ncbi:MAG: hypothetical protein QOD56_3118, partial [Gammaproteobacteria bacterium]|nr:hypothetical protein [Gammaproteobacteria bacterium]